jgi:hypothetical protein
VGVKLFKRSARFIRLMVGYVQQVFEQLSWTEPRRFDSIEFHRKAPCCFNLVLFPIKTRHFSFFFEISRPALGLTHPPIIGYRGLFLGLQLTGTWNWTLVYI